MNGVVAVTADVDCLVHPLARETLLEPFIAVARAQNQVMLRGSTWLRCYCRPFKQLARQLVARNAPTT